MYIKICLPHFSEVHLLDKNARIMECCKNLKDNYSYRNIG